MANTDITDVAAVHKVVFPRQSCSKDWISCTYSAYPKTQFFVAEVEGRIQGYINWVQKSGFRKSVVLELEQIAVTPSIQGNGVGKNLIRQSLPIVKERLAERGAVLKHLVVTTRADNEAQQLYRNVLGAEVEATVHDLYSADEVIMVVRNVAGET